MVHVEGRIDPLRDSDVVETELLLADLESLEKRLPAAQKKAKGGDADAAEQAAMMERVLAVLNANQPARAVGRPRPGRAEAARRPATADGQAGAVRVQRGRGQRGRRERPVGEGGGDGRGAGRAERGRVRPDRGRDRLLPTAEEKQEFLGSLGLAETGLSRVIRAGYRLLDLVTYFTVGPKESAGVDDPGRHAGPAGGRGDPHRLRDAGSSGPRRSPTTITSSSAARPGRRRPAGSGSKGRSTWFRTGTCCTSGSGYEPCRRGLPRHFDVEQATCRHALKAVTECTTVCRERPPWRSADG